MRVNQANANTNAAYRILKNEEFKNQLHEERWIHIHDKEYTGVSYNCIGIELKEKLIELKEVLEEMEIDDALDYIFQVIVNLTNDQSGGIGFINIDSDLAEFVQEVSEEKLITKIRRLYQKLNLPLRNGYEKAYVSFNLGLDTSENGRKTTRCFLKAFEYGEILNGLPFVFPNIIFKVKKGINFDLGDKNYDLFSLATRVTGKRMNPTYFNCDNVLVKDINEKKVGIMGCRTLVAKNVNGEEGALTVIGAVSPPGGDISEPVSQSTLRIAKVFWGLDYALSYRRHFPAINWLNSYSLYQAKMDKYKEEEVDKDFPKFRIEAMALLQEEAKLQEIVRLVGRDSLSEFDQLKLEITKSLREDFLQQNAFHEVDTYCSLPKQFKMLKLILSFYDEAQRGLKEGVYLNEILALPAREKITRAKNISEKELDSFDKIEEEIKEAVSKLIAEGGKPNA